MCKHIFMVGFVALLAACASNPQATMAANSKDDSKVTCTMETATGSNVPKKVCRSKQDQTEEQRENQRNMEILRQQLYMQSGNPP